MSLLKMKKKKKATEFLKARHKHHNNLLRALKGMLNLKSTNYESCQFSLIIYIIFGLEVKITEDFTDW